MTKTICPFKDHQLRVFFVKNLLKGNRPGGLPTGHQRGPFVFVRSVSSIHKTEAGELHLLSNMRISNCVTSHNPINKGKLDK